MDTIRERLIKAREDLDISQQEVADRCGWKHHSRINNYEKGKAAPKDLDAIERLAHALETTPGWLAFGEAEGLKLSAEERTLLDNFRRADDKHRALAAMLLEAAAPDPEPPDPSKSERPRPIVLTSAAINSLKANNRRT